MHRFKILLPGLILGWLLSGCATQMPASEGLIFTEETEYQNSEGPFADKISYEWSGGISYLPPLKNVEHAAADEYGEKSYNKLDPSFLFALPVPSFSVAYCNRVALGSSVPALGLWQMDGTVRMFGQYYFTLTKKILFYNTEVIFQRRMWFKNNGGFSLGAFYRYDPLQLTEENNPSLNNRIHISWFGVRSVFQTPDQLGTGIHLRGHVSGGYIPEFKTPLITFGISFAFRFHNERRSEVPKPSF